MSPEYIQTVRVVLSLSENLKMSAGGAGSGGSGGAFRVANRVPSGYSRSQGWRIHVHPRLQVAPCQPAGRPLAARSRGLARVTTDSYLLEGQPNLSYVSNGGSHLLIRILRSDIYSS